MSARIRHSVFETNSSSSHSLTVSPSTVVPPPVSRTAARAGRLVLAKGEYGWEWVRYYDPQNKLRYLFTQALDGDDVPDGNPETVRTKLFEDYPAVERLFDVFERHTGVRVVPVPGSKGYVDHQSEEVGRDLLDDEDALARFLFDADSYVETGNDNERPPRYIDTDVRGTELYYGDAVVERAPEGFVEVQLFYLGGLHNKACATTRKGRSFEEAGADALDLLWRAYDQGVVTSLAYYMNRDRRALEGQPLGDVALSDALGSRFYAAGCNRPVRTRALENLRVEEHVDTRQRHGGVVATLAVPADIAQALARFEGAPT